MTQRLIDILHNLLHDRGPAAPRLSGGMMMQYRAADEAQGARLLCYRVGAFPSETEIATVRRHLEKLLPEGTVISQRFAPAYTGGDGLIRRGSILSWEMAAVPQQTSLLGSPTGAGASAVVGK